MDLNNEFRNKLIKYQYSANAPVGLANPTEESGFALGLEKSGREGLAKRRKDVGKAVVFWQSRRLFSLGFAFTFC